MRGFLKLLRRALPCLLLFAVCARANEVRIELTDTEKAWLKEHPIVYFGYDPGWGPFSYRDERGDFAGIDKDYLTLLGNRLGVRFAPVHTRSWPEAYEAAKAGSVDFLVSTAEDPERAKFFVFTKPYNVFPMAFVARKESKGFYSMDQLRGHRVAMANGYVSSLMIHREYPEVPRVLVNTMEEAFLAVSAGRADVAATNVANANYIIESLGLTNLKIAGIMPYLFELRYAVRNDRAILRDILDKGVASLSSKDRQEIVGPWVKVEYENIIRWDYVMRWILGAFFVIGAFLVVIIRHNRSLRRELAERSRMQAELETARATLEQLNEEKSGILRMAAHDLRNPLNGLMLNIEILRDGAGSSERESLDRMMTLVNHMIHMIRNLLDVQAIEDGRRSLKSEPLDLEVEIREALSALRPQAERKRIALHAQFARVLPPVLADQGALRQVINNLLSNALKYSPHERDVTVVAEPGRTGRIIFRVIDKGPGIAPADLPRLFHKYARFGARPTGGEHSIGLGLAIVKQLVMAMGGTVQCESKLNEGSSFIVDLPAATIGREKGQATGSPFSRGEGEGI